MQPVPLRSTSLRVPLLADHDDHAVASSLPSSALGSSANSNPDTLRFDSSSSSSSSEHSLGPSYPKPISEDQRVSSFAHKLLNEDPLVDVSKLDPGLEEAEPQGCCSRLFGKVKSCVNSAIAGISQFWKSRDPCVKETVCCLAGCGTAVAAGLSAPGSSTRFEQVKRTVLQCSAFFTGLFCQSAVNVRGWDEAADDTEDTTKPLCERKIAEVLLEQAQRLKREQPLENVSMLSMGEPQRLPPTDGNFVEEPTASDEEQAVQESIQQVAYATREDASDADGCWVRCFSAPPAPQDGLIEYPNMPRNCNELGLTILSHLSDCKNQPWIQLKRAWLWLIEYKPTELIWTLNALVYLNAYFRQDEVFIGSALGIILTAGAGVHLSNILQNTVSAITTSRDQSIEPASIGCWDLVKRACSSGWGAIKECGKSFSRVAALAALQATGIYLAVTNFDATEGLYPSQSMIFGAVGTIMTAVAPAYIVSKLLSGCTGPCLKACSERTSNTVMAIGNKMPLLLAAIGNSLIDGTGHAQTVAEYRRLVWAGLILMGLATGARFVLPARDHVGARIPRHPRKWSDRTFVEKASLGCFKSVTACLLTGYAISGLLNKSGYVNAPQDSAAVATAMLVHAADQYIKTKRIEAISSQSDGSLWIKIASIWHSLTEYLPFTVLTNFQAFFGGNIANWDTYISHALLGAALGLSASDRTDQKHRDKYQGPLTGRAHL